MVNRHQQLVLGQTVNAGDQLPGMVDGLFLEIVTKGKIAQHFEKRVVAGGVANIFKVIVLAAGTNAFL